MGARRVASTVTAAYQTAARKYATNKVLNKLNEIVAHEKNRVVSGLMAGTPTTPSSQAAGVGNTDWNVDLTAGLVVVDGVAAEFAVQADFDVHSGSMYTDLHAGDSAIATIVAKNTGGTITLEVVKGAAALDGAQVAPTDEEINTAMGAGNNWVKVAELLLQRTGDAAVAQTQNNKLRPLFGVTVSTTFTTTV